MLITMTTIDLIATASRAADEAGSGRCEECHHERAGHATSPILLSLTKKLRMKEPSIQCASFSRDDSFGDVHYCSCSNASHEVDVRAGFENHIQVEEQ